MQDGKADFHTHLKCTSYITPYMLNQVFLKRRVHICMCLHIHVCVGMCVCLCVCRYVCSYVGWEKVQDLSELELQAIVGHPASQVGAGISALLLYRAADFFKCRAYSSAPLSFPVVVIHAIQTHYCCLRSLLRKEQQPRNLTMILPRKSSPGNPPQDFSRVCRTTEALSTRSLRQFLDWFF